MRRGLVTTPVEIDLLVGSHFSRLALQLLVREIFTFETCRCAFPTYCQYRSGNRYDGLTSQSGTKCVENFGARCHSVSDSGQRCDRFRGSPTVVPQEYFRRVSVWPNDGDGLHVLLQWERMVVVFEQHNGFPCRLERQCTVLSSVVF